jgi:predicted HicB family RNase H-like nuclease
MEYRGYHGTIELSASDETLTGKVLGISTPISYEGDNLQSLREDFKAGVDRYLNSCASSGRTPEKPSNQFEATPTTLQKMPASRLRSQMVGSEDTVIYS